MKKGLRITIVSLLSLIGLALISSCIVVLCALSPARLTKIVNKEAPRWITCDFKTEKVDLTFFKTFPKVGLDIHHATLINPMFGAQSDTLLHIRHCIASVNIRKLLQENTIEVKNFRLEDGTINLFTNNQGKNNFDVFKSDTSKPSSEFNYAIDLQKINTKNINVSYIDLKSGFLADIDKVNLNVKGQYADKSANGKAKLSTNKFIFKTLTNDKVLAKYEKLDFDFQGDLKNLDKIGGNLNVSIDEIFLGADTNTYLCNMNITLKSDLQTILSSQDITLHDTKLTFNQHELFINGTAHREKKKGDLTLDFQYETGKRWPIKEVLALIPQAVIGNALDGLDIDGKAALSGKIYGHYNVNQMPVITAKSDVIDGSFSKKDFPLTFNKINTLFRINLDLNNQTDVNIERFCCYTGHNYMTANGKIADLLGKMLFDINLTGDLHIPDFKELLPEKLTRCNGNAKASVSAKFDFEQLSNLAIDQWTATGTFEFTNLDIIYDDSLSLSSPAMKMDIRFPLNEQPYNIGECIFASINADNLKGGMLGLGNIDASGAHINVYLNNIMDSTLALKVGAEYKFGTLVGKMDTIDATLYKPEGTFVMKDSKNLILDYMGEALVAHIGKDMTAQSSRLKLDATTHYNEHGSNALMQWNPIANISLQNGSFQTAGLGVPIELTSIKASIDPHQCDIQQGTGIFGNSDFTLKGKIYNIDDFFYGRDLMKGTLDLTSNFIDINQIIDIVSGLGAPDSVLAEKPEDSEKDPFMVPFGIDLRMNTQINKALYEDAYFRNIGGHVDLKDGILVLEEMGVTHDAARMQLTALYKSPRKNHLFLGLDFHLLDIKIDKLIALIPEVDTILPMLKSFAGNAEFHFAIETNLKSDYTLKYSTLRGAAAINGKDLVVLDNETYRNIAKKLLFKKSTQNKIDSLSAEITIFKNEIDVYPFLVSLDKYQAILSGRHKLDMTYDYNISLIKPLRIGLDIIGTDKRRFKVGKPKYATLFQPERQNIVEQNVMQLKSQISNALKANVKPQDSKSIPSQNK